MRAPARARSGSVLVHCLFLLLAVAAAPSSPQLPARRDGAVASAALAAAPTRWAAVASAGTDSATVVLESLGGGPAARRWPFPGAHALGRIALLGDSTLLVVQPDVSRPARVVSRRLSPGTSRWSDAVAVAARRDARAVALGRAIDTASGSWLVPVLWTGGEPGGTLAAVYRSGDAGRSWKEVGTLPQDGQSCALAEASPERLVLVVRCGERLLQSVSRDGGKSWSRGIDLGIASGDAPVELARSVVDARLALLWTSPPDSEIAPPAMPALRVALSTDAGGAWREAPPLRIRPGRVPTIAAALLEPAGLTTLVADRPPGEVSLVCSFTDLGRLDPAAPRAAPPPYGLDPAATYEALAVWTAHTLARPASHPVLFVEGYFHRSLMAAHAALGSPPPRREAWVDPAAALGRAVAFGDSLVGAQSFRGHWKTGYRADWWADMGAAAAIFAGLEAHVDTTRARQYERAARRFLGALEREGMLRADGSVAMGRADAVQYGRRVVVREPYLVSTALVGIEVRAWLARRSGDAVLRQQALAALDWTLSRLQPNGALTDPKSGEGALRLAAYTQEGWMAADLLLDEPGLADKLRDALRPHVDWLLQVQDPDGTWVPGDVEESARTPPILDFLIWYDQRCESRPEIRDAIRRGAAAYVDPARWKSIGLFGTGPHDVVRRALAGRTLAALHLGRYLL